MYFEQCGKGAPILFLHGWGADGNIFKAVAASLPNNTCYLMDFVGFGQSEKPPMEGWSVLDYANDVANFVEQQNLSQLTIVAHSFGCRVAMVLAAKWPNMVKRMLLVAPAGLRMPSLKRWLKVVKYKTHKFLCKLGLSQNVGARFGSVDYLACENWLKNTFVKVVNQDLSKYARHIKCPTLIVNGNNDKDTPLKHAKRLKTLIKGSSLVEIDGDHFAFFRSPQAFAKTIHIFEES